MTTAITPQLRFCPFCSADNDVSSALCVGCGRHLPPVPARRISAAVPSASTLAATLPVPQPSAGPDAATLPVSSGPEAATVGVRRTITKPPPLPSSIAAAAQRAVGEPELAGPSPSSSLSASVPPMAAHRRANTDSVVPLPGSLGRRRGETGESAAPSTIPPPWAGPVAPLAAPEVDEEATVVAGAPTSEGPDAARRPRAPSMPPPLPIGRNPRGESEPPPTVMVQNDGFVRRPYAPAKVVAMPEVPDGGLVRSVQYALGFTRARHQRRGAIKQLSREISFDTSALDAVLGSLGKAARGGGADHKAFSIENAAIEAAELRRTASRAENAEVQGRRAEEDRRFREVEIERSAKVAEAERVLAEAEKQREHVEAQRRSLREKRKELERRQRAYYKAADDRESEAGSTAVGGARDELRRAAEQHRDEAAGFDVEKREIDQSMVALDGPALATQGEYELAKAALDDARQSLHDVREGHAQRGTELDDEQRRKAKDLADTDAEIARRLVTLGTLVNLNRVDGPEYADLYARVDRIRAAIGARTTEIDKLTAERSGFDRPTLIRGYVTLAGAVVAVIVLVLVLRALL